jgi:hypothetical protein
MAEVMIFKAGKYPQGDFPKERVKKMVDAYNPDAGEAPVVIGHFSFGAGADTEDAQGWVKSLRMDGSGKVYAEFSDLSDTVKEKVATGKLRYMSVEIYEYDKDAPDQPPYLAAVALLGRHMPQVPGTKILPALFALGSGGFAQSVNEEQRTSTFTQKLDAGAAREFAAQEDTAREGSAQNKDTTEEVDGVMSESEKEELKKLQADFAASQSRFEALQKENAELKAAGVKAESEAYFGKLRDEGKLSPAQFEKAAAFDGKLESAELRTEFRALFQDAAPQLDLSGKHFAAKDKAAGAGNKSLAATIRTFQKEKNLADFQTAADALYAEKPELFADAEGAV